jgi:hypothetical protein
MGTRVIFVPTRDGAAASCTQYLLRFEQWAAIGAGSGYTGEYFWALFFRSLTSESLIDLGMPRMTPN